MSEPNVGRSYRSGAIAMIGRMREWLEEIPYNALAIPLRFAVATVFWSSAMTKLANWDSALALFVEEYKVRLIPPEVAAYVAVSIELTRPVLLVRWDHVIG